MNEMENPLIRDILEKAEAMAERKLRDARREADQIILEASSRAALAEKSLERTLEKNLEEIALKEEGEKRNIDRLVSLRSQDRALETTLERLVEKLEALKNDRERYEKILVEWAAEACIGLGKDQALVAFWPQAPFSEQMLRQTEALVEKRTGAKVHLSLCDKPLESFGVALFSTDMRVSYNNRMDYRLHRRQKEIRKIVQDITCKAE